MKRLLLAVPAALLLAGPAHAADHEATLSASATSFKWEGAPALTRGAPLFNQDVRTSIPCGAGPLRQCEEVLLDLAEDGRLALKVKGLEGTGGTTDVDLYVYRSDKDGAQGELVAAGTESGDDSVTVPKAKAGHYLALVDYYHAYNSGYEGQASFTAANPPADPPAVAPPAPPAPTAAAPPAPAKKKAKKKPSCQAKAKKLKNKRKRAAAMKKCRRAAKKRRR